MIEIEGKINNLPVSIFIDFGATFSYVNTNLVERYKLVAIKLHKNILVQLAIGMKRKVTVVVEDCKFTMNGLEIKSNLDIIPLGSCDYGLPQKGCDFPG